MFLKIVKLASIIIIYLFFLAVLARDIGAHTIIFQDDFSNGLNKWTSYRGDINDWYISVDGMAGTYIKHSGIKREIVPKDEWWNSAWGNYIIEYDFYAKEGTDKVFTFRVNDYDKWYEFHHTQGQIYLQKIYPGETDTLASVNYIIKNDIRYHIKMTVIGDYITFCITPESSDEVCPIQVEDTNTSLKTGKISLRAGAGSVYPTEVYYDNIVVKLIENTIGPFELPFDHEGRLSESGDDFRSAFWGRMTAAFDHERKGGKHIPYTGELFKKNKCKKGDIGIECYDKHHGTDFDDCDRNTEECDASILSVADGEVVYASEHDGNGCTPEKGGFGCVVIVQYDNTPAGTVYGLYAHLSEIYSSFDSYPDVTESTQIGVMGNTGCKKCGEHLHFGVLKALEDLALSASKEMKKKDWQELLFTIQPQSTPNIKHYCTYRAPNGMRYTFLDPSGWRGSNFLYPADPWQEACGVESPYLWKYNIGIQEPESLSNFLHPIMKFLED